MALRLYQQHPRPCFKWDSSKQIPPCIIGDQELQLYYSHTKFSTAILKQLNLLASDRIETHVDRTELLHLLSFHRRIIFHDDVVQQGASLNPSLNHANLYNEAKEDFDRWFHTVSGASWDKLPLLAPVISAFTPTELFLRCLFLEKEAGWRDIEEFVGEVKDLKYIKNLAGLNTWTDSTGNAIAPKKFHGSSTMMHIAQVPKDNDKWVIISSTKINWAEGSQDIRELHRAMRNARFSNQEMNMHHQNRNHFSQYYEENCKKVPFIELIESFREQKFYSPGNRYEWLSFAIEVPSLKERDPCILCYATTDFGVGIGQKSLKDIIGNQEIFRQRKNDIECAEVSSTVLKDRLGKEQGRQTQAIIELFVPGTPFDCDLTNERGHDLDGEDDSFGMRSGMAG